MANKKITDLPDIGTPDALDVLEIVDVSTNTSKKVLFSELGGGGGSQSLDEVLAVGNTTDLTAVFQSFTGSKTTILPSGIFLENVENDQTLACTNDEIQRVKGDFVTVINFQDPTGYGTISVPDVVDESETLALLSDIPTVANATETVAGIAEIATTSEVTTGTDDTRIVTPLKLKEVTDLKQNQILIAKKTINSTALTGTTAEGILESIFIPANTYAVGDIMKIINAMNKTGTAGNSLLRTRINTINSLTGSVIISTGGTAASNVLSGANPERHFNIRSGNLIEGYPFTIGGVFENGNANVQRTSTTFDPTQDVYLLLTAQLGSASDSIVNAQYLLEKY